MNTTMWIGLAAVAGIAWFWLQDEIDVSNGNVPLAPTQSVTNNQTTQTANNATTGATTVQAQSLPVVVTNAPSQTISFKDWLNNALKVNGLENRASLSFDEWNNLYRGIYNTPGPTPARVGLTNGNVQLPIDSYINLMRQAEWFGAW